MKKCNIVFILLCFAFILTAAGCGLSPEEQQAIDTVDQANASQIATAINAHNALYPEDVIMSLDGLDTIEKIKEAVGEALYPKGLSDEDGRNALRFLILENGVAGVKSIGR